MVFICFTSPDKTVGSTADPAAIEMVDDSSVVVFDRLEATEAELTVVIPVFNEVQTIREVLERVIAEVTPKDVVIVDDGSRDGTHAVLAEWCDQWKSTMPPAHVRRVWSVRHPINRGKGVAIRTGLEFAQSKFVIVQDADLEVSPKEYPGLLQPLLADKADFVIGYRSLSNENASRLTFRAGIWLLNLTVRLLYGIRVRDEACCFKLLQTRDMKRMKLECRGFEFCPEVVAKAARLGLRFAEVPIAYHPRMSAEGKKLQLRDGLIALLTLWKYRHWQETPRES